ncbi:hypothetical protein J3A83DRAFT_223743 [Scleroderma citrinum]
MNHAIVPKFANPHFFSQGYERTSRAKHTKDTDILAENTQDEATGSLKRELDEMLHESWIDALQAVHDTKRPQKSGKWCNATKCGSGTDEDGKVLFRLLSSTNNPQPISLRPKPLPIVRTREPEWEDSPSMAEERQKRAQSVAVEFDGQWCTWGALQRQETTKALVTVGAFPIPPPSVMVTEESSPRTPTRRRLRATAPQTVDKPSPHELKTICALLVPVQTLSDTKTVACSSRRRCRRKSEQEKRPPPVYWKPPTGLRGKCLGYALGYPSNWGNTSVSRGRYTRDVMKRGVHA